jgi:hypothetical protein
MCAGFANKSFVRLFIARGDRMKQAKADAQELINAY